MEQAEIGTRLEGLANIIARMLDSEHKESELQLEVLKTSDNATSVKVLLNGKPGFLKLFGDGEQAVAAFDRECKALDFLHGNQIPRLLFVAKAEHVILTEFIEGRPYLETMTAQNVMQKAEHLGQWFGRQSNNSPTEKADTNWSEYLSRYRAGLETDILEQQQPVLEQNTITRLTLAHNDNAFGNFILGKDKRLYAVDFEDSRMKPEGWDLVTATRAFFGLFPDQLEIISGSMLRGYQLSAENSTLADNFDQVLNVLALSMVLAET